MIERLRRFVSKISLKYTMYFTWNVDSQNGIVVQLNNGAMNDILLDKINAIAKDFEFEIDGWGFSEDVFNIRLRQVVSIT